MTKNYKKNQLATYLALIFLAALLGTKFVFPRAQESFGSISEEKTFWEGRIEAAGGDGAWQEFKERYRGLDEGQSHILAHLFGEVLYEVLGDKGFAACDDSFMYGCGHGLMKKPVEERGLDALVFFGKECYKLFPYKEGSGCTHGLGHLLIEYLEYDLKTALETCKLLPYGGSIQGCPSGVFMEYNRRDFKRLDASLSMENALGRSAVQVRQLDPADPYEPCSTLPQGFLPACYAAQPEWWFIVFKGDFKKLGELCGGLEEESLKNICWQQTGYVAWRESRTGSSNAADLCKEMPSSAGERQCQAGAGRGAPFFSGETDSGLMIAEEKAFWTSRIEKVGGKEAYREFKIKYADELAPEVHILAHLFGEALFEALGDQGLGICDPDFQYGCYHGFMKGPVSRNGGLEAFLEMGKKCNELFPRGGIGCTHGLGHYLVEYVGYDLIKALNTCKLLPEPGYLDGCFGGVFMEYNFSDFRRMDRAVSVETVLDNSSVPFRKLNPADPHEPCSNLAEEFLPPCYYAEPQWWGRVYDGNLEKVGQLCLEAPGEDLQKICWRQTGYIAWREVGFDPEKLVEVCQKMPLTLGRDECLAGVVERKSDSLTDTKKARIMEIVRKFK